MKRQITPKSVGKFP